MLTLFWMATANATVRPHALFSNGMVLQRGAICKVWGRADAGEAVTVSFLGRTATATPDSTGVWVASLDLRDVNGPNYGPYVMTISGSNLVTIKDVYVGEVWVCAGQSNMAIWLNLFEGGPPSPMVRMFTVQGRMTAQPVYGVYGSWEQPSATNYVNFSSVGYHFARHLSAALGNVPVAMINANWGGTRGEAWTPGPALVALGGTFKSNYQNFLTATQFMHPNSPSVLYNGMIAPLQNYTIRGVIWYQGENNVPNAYNYRKLFPALIQSWRDSWGLGEFPFLYVQIAPYLRASGVMQTSDRAELRESQLLTLSVPNTGMVVTTDYGHEADIHPRPKEPVGYRLSLLAREKAYGHELISSGPVLKSISFTGQKAILKFENVGTGLKSLQLIPTDTRRTSYGTILGSAWRVKPVSAGAVLKGFALCGPKGYYVDASAKIIAPDTVEVFSPLVSAATGVRYGWAHHPICGLYNSANLPASPFRSDNFATATTQKP
jgi:sialate O-acetylesterase